MGGAVDHRCARPLANGRFRRAASSHRWRCAPAPTERNQLRLSFALPDKPISCARVYAATAGYSALWLNGERVNNHGDELGPWTSWGIRVLYRAYDVTASLRPGSNLLGVWLGRGVSRRRCLPVPLDFACVGV